MEPMVSIVVPVYNAQRTLRRCIESVLHQEYEDFELLLVDDGSTDSSGTVCEEYAAVDRRVRVIRRENQGVSAARNAALDGAHGTYLQFLDSDDWITPDATKLLVRAALEYQCDLVISDFYRVVGERLSQKGDIEEDTLMSQEEYAAHMMENPADFYYGVLWNKLYRRDIVEKYHLRMNAEISWCEDFMFNLEYILHGQVFYALHVPTYYYMKTKGSLASQGGNLAKAIRMKFLVFEYYNNFYKNVFDEELYEKNRLQVYRFLIDAAGDGTVMPSIMPSTTKLGQERSGVSTEALAGEGAALDLYRQQKLLDYYLETAALKNSLTLEQARALLYLNRIRVERTRRELADDLEMTVRGLSLVLQKLVSKGFIQMEEVRRYRAGDGKRPEAEDGGKQVSRQKLLRITILPASRQALADFEQAQSDYEEARFEGFTEEDLAAYARLEERIRENTRRILK